MYIDAAAAAYLAKYDLPKYQIREECSPVWQDWIEFAKLRVLSLSSEKSVLQV